MVDIGPELFQDVEHAIQSDLCEPFLAGLGPGAFTRGVIGVRNSGASAVANNFRNVKGGMAGIGARDEQAAHRIAGALDKAAVSEGVVSRVFVRQRGNDGFRQVVSNGLVGDGTLIVAAKRCAAAKLRIRELRAWLTPEIIPEETKEE